MKENDNIMKNKMLFVLVLVLGIVIFKNQISIALMYAVDCIGYAFNINVVDIIDLLNTIYYL
jgi:hypothetical protein|nr:MAG TPA: Small glutamine-rich tetratricopeptide repeat-containing protein-helix bundle, Protein-protein interaction, Ubl4A.35A [Caudoviricetes sp.]